MTKYVVKRLLQLIPIILGITFLSYAMMQVAGSDFIEQAANNTGTVMSAEAMQKAREALGLDKPFIIQYFNWLGGLLHGDMGVSYVSNKDVFSTFISKLPATLLLTLTSVIATMAIAIPLGILARLSRIR